MNLTPKNIWITINIIFAACMVISVVTKGFVNITYLFIGLTNFSALLYLLVYKISKK